MFDYVNDYCSQQITFDHKGKNFEINNDNDLKFLLYGIEQRFYTRPFGKEKCWQTQLSHCNYIF